MKTEWKTAYCPTSPKEFEQLNESTYIQRRNVEEQETEEYGTRYVCEFRYISSDVYASIMYERINTVYEKTLEAQEENAQLLLNQIDIINTQAAQDATMAEILLSVI